MMSTKLGLRRPGSSGNGFLVVSGFEAPGVEEPFKSKVVYSILFYSVANSILIVYAHTVFFQKWHDWGFKIAT